MDLPLSRLPTTVGRFGTLPWDGHHFGFVIGGDGGKKSGTSVEPPTSLGRVDVAGWFH